ncbi:hypothetical protein D3C72_1581010 [compost metagenome]
MRRHQRARQREGQWLVELAHGRNRDRVGAIRLLALAAEGQAHHAFEDHGARGRANLGANELDAVDRNGQRGDALGVRAREDLRVEGQVNLRALGGNLEAVARAPSRSDFRRQHHADGHPRERVGIKPQSGNRRLPVQAHEAGRLTGDQHSGHEAGGDQGTQGAHGHKDSLLANNL